MTNKLTILPILIGVLYFHAQCQDTFSIVAVDSVTGEVGSAGASCVDLFQTSFSNDDFLSELIPGVGAINTQAYYLPANQNNATNQMNLGQTPSQIIQWLTLNDVGGQPEIRQYGIAGLVSGAPQTAAHTGTSTNDYKNHVVGPNYAIQGNILLGQLVLDSMEARFLNEDGDLACKLMAALQGANMVGADTRCASNGTSSLFAFVKVAQSTDTFGSPSFLTSVRTSDGAGIEPIDSLQIKFDLLQSCGQIGMEENQLFSQFFKLFPNPAHGEINISCLSKLNLTNHFSIIQMDGSVVLDGNFSKSISIDLSKLNSGAYMINIQNEHGIYTKKIVIK